MGSNWSAFWGIKDLLAAIALGFALYFGAAYALVGKARIMSDNEGRILAISDFLRTEVVARHEKFTAVLGSSVVMEGIDGELVGRELSSGWRCYNFSFVGAYPPHWLLLLDSLAQAQPAEVVLCIDAWIVPQRRSISDERIVTAAWWNLIPQRELAEFDAYLKDGEQAELKKSSAALLLAFRSCLTDAFEERMREALRPDLRFDGLKSNFTAPWVHRGRIWANAFENHLRTFEFTDEWNEQHFQTNQQLLQRIVGYLRAREIPVILVLNPVHPRLGGERHDATLRRVQQEVANLADLCRVPWLDYSELLGDNGFCDAVHPGTDGRRVVSQALGHDLSKVR